MANNLLRFSFFFFDNLFRCQLFPAHEPPSHASSSPLQFENNQSRKNRGKSVTKAHTRLPVLPRKTNESIATCTLDGMLVHRRIISYFYYMNWTALQGFPPMRKTVSPNTPLVLFSATSEWQHVLFLRRDLSRLLLASKVFI